MKVSITPFQGVQTITTAQVVCESYGVPSGIRLEDGREYDFINLLSAKFQVLSYEPGERQDVELLFDLLDMYAQG